jgi:hypothetical protein
LCLPFRQFEQVLLRDLAFFRPVAQVSSLLSGKAFPLYLGHGSAPEYQSAELIHQTVLQLRVVVREILF